MAASTNAPPPSSPPTGTETPLVSIIMPVHNSAKFLDDAFQSIVNQTYRGNVQVSVYDDGSTDDSPALIKLWADKFNSHPSGRFSFVSSSAASIGAEPSQGPGFARNRAVQQSTGGFLCFLDSDDEMMPNRIELQLPEAMARSNCIVGARIDRKGGTERYTAWCNSLTQEQLVLQQYRELTVIQPTWFMQRAVFEAVGGYSEEKGKLKGPAGSSAGVAGANKKGESGSPALSGTLLTMEPPSSKRQRVTEPGALATPNKATEANPPTATLCSDPDVPVPSSAPTSCAAGVTGTEPATPPTDPTHAEWIPRAGAGGPGVPTVADSPRPVQPIREPFPEDLDFFHRHLDRGGNLFVVDEVLLHYRMNPGSQSWRTSRKTLLRLRAAAFERRVLSAWPVFSIWGAGRDGKDFFKALSPASRKKVSAFLDLDPSKVGTTYHYAPESLNIPVIHWSKSTPPIAVCVAMDRTGGELVRNVNKLGLTEGVDYWYIM